MKNRRIFMGIPAVMLVFVSVFAGCSQPANEEGGGPVVIKITNVSGFESAMVWVFAEMPEGQSAPTNTAVGFSNVKNGVLEVSLSVPKDNTTTTNTPWRGGDGYYVAIVKVENNSLTDTSWGYKKGEEFAKLAINYSASIELDFTNDFKSTSSSG